MQFSLKALSLALMLTTSAAQAELVYVGSQDHQIQAFRLDTRSGKFTPAGKVAEGIRPTWVTAHPHLPVLYAVDDDSAKEGSVTAFSVNRDTGALNKIDDVATKGKGTTNLYFDVPSSTLLTANYNSGSVSSIAVNGDGSLGALVSTVSETGSGPNKRQASAHAHNAVVDPSGRHVLVSDFGADRVFIYGFDRTTHALSPLNQGTFVAPPGSGPRHLVFGADGRFVYLITELSADVMVLRWDAAQGRLTHVQSLPISSVDFQGTKSGAEIVMSRDGRFVYVENRGENQMIVYRVDRKSGELEAIQRVASGGDKPWGFAIDETGKWLVVANQHDGKVATFRIDSSTGKLTDTGQFAEVEKPVAIAFIP